MAAQIRFSTGKVESFSTLAKAASAFVALYEEYPDVVVLCGVPRPHFRENTRGETIHLSSDDGEIEMAAEGRFYHGAALKNSRHVRGMGYMAPMLDERTDYLIDSIPSDAIEGDYLHGREWIDPVRIGSLIVEQAEISRVVRETGKLPDHLVHADYSGSVVSVSEIAWGDVPQILGMVA